MLSRVTVKDGEVTQDDPANDLTESAGVLSTVSCGEDPHLLIPAYKV